MKLYNFSAGPAVLPQSVLKQVQESMINYQESGMSVLELSHRSELFRQIIKDAERLLRELLSIPDEYKVLFLQGGASLQFSMLPLNVARGKKVQYINTGIWATKAIEAARSFSDIEVEIVASSEDTRFTTIPNLDENQIDPQAAYVHITTNETIGGVAYHKLPDTQGVPLVADMSSNFLSNDYQISDFAMIYAGAQKNLGPAGLTVVILREDFLNKQPVVSKMLDYQVQSDHQSMYNTPPTFAIYVAKLVLEWVKEQGGVPAIVLANQKKANLLYQALENSTLFSNPVAKNSRSIMNIPFTSGDEKIDSAFLQAAKKAGFENLNGHHSVGGMRASLYNAFPMEGVQALVTFIETFEQSIRRK